MKARAFVLVLVVIVGLTGCAKKGRPLVPLALDRGATPRAVTLPKQGTQAYQTKQFDAAKQYFSQAVAADPQSGQTHYNYALALNALGDVDVGPADFLRQDPYDPLRHERA